MPPSTPQIKKIHKSVLRGEFPPIFKNEIQALK